MTTFPAVKRAHVTYFPYKHGQFKDVTAEYEGEVVRDNADWIEILCNESPMTFSKDRVIVTAARQL